MDTVQLIVDQENNALDFWGEVYARLDSADIPEPGIMAALVRGTAASCTVTQAEARSIMAWCRNLPSWDDDAPALLVRELAEE